MEAIEPMHHIDPSDLEPIDRYKLLIGAVVPRPIGWIGSLSADGVTNLAPYSFFNVVSADPATVLFSSNRGTRMKDTLANVVSQGAFTANIVTEDLAAAMNATAGEYPPEVSEFEIAGLTPIPGTVVSAPMVAEAPIRLECRVSRTIDIGRDGAEPSNTVVFGEVVALHVAERVLDGTRIRPDELRAVGRMAGSGYTTTVDGFFEMVRPIV
jgi:flavin reductase (DIM6/NTAB) family NADH-FMN oxidoreductase RutF